ncbi:MAG: hypothetical protein H6736_17045 [Alphaproteobacteria bacterium]|nr:hypothetical protein [Alphaproteobacteria bacterium]
MSRSRPSSFVIVAPPATPTTQLVSALRAAGSGASVLVEADPSLAIAKVHEQPLAIFTTVELLDDTLAAMGRDRWRVFILNDQPDERSMQTALADPRIGGLLGWRAHGGRSWELRYLARRLVAPLETPPNMGALLGWGVSTFAFLPRTTAEERATVVNIEGLAKRLGLGRREAELTSTAAHELMMNAVYDAPVDAEGKLKYALDRTKNIELLPDEVPTLVFTVSAEYVALDMIDPFGRLPRPRFFEAVLRGHRNVLYGRSDLDTSMGGAGLGLHTLYSSGCLLRAEMQPSKLTHVSWVLDRRLSREEARSQPRSLFYLPFRVETR